MSPLVQRLVLVGVAVAALVGGVALTRSASPAEPVPFGSATSLPMPAVPSGVATDTAWFCPVVGASADGELGGRLLLLNPTDQALATRVTLVPLEGDERTIDVDVPAGELVEVVPADTLNAPFVAASIEVFGPGLAVQQVVTTPAGEATAPCVVDASPSWYVADGATTADATSSFLLFNPFPEDAIVDVTFATEEGVRTPQALQGYVVPGRSLRRIDVDEAVRRNRRVSIAVDTRSGRVVAGRLQQYRFGGRRGVIGGPATAAPGDVWWFANGRKGGDVAERIALYNPGDVDAQVDISLYPADPSAEAPVEPIGVDVPAGGNAVVDLSANELVPEGRHSIVVASENGVAVVVERALDLTSDLRRTTTSQAGARLIAGTWYLPTPTPRDGTAAVTIANPIGVETVVSVVALTPQGRVPLTGGDSLTLPPAGLVRVELAAADAPPYPLVVEANGPVVVEHFLLPTPGLPGAASTLGIPVEEAS